MEVSNLLLRDYFFDVEIPGLKFEKSFDVEMSTFDVDIPSAR